MRLLRSLSNRNFRDRNYSNSTVPGSQPLFIDIKLMDDPIDRRKFCSAITTITRDRENIYVTGLFNRWYAI